MVNNHITDRIDEYLLGSLDHAAQANVEAHLANCGACRLAVESNQEVSVVMSWLPNPEAAPQPGPDFFYRVQAEIERRQERSWLGNMVAVLQPRLALPFVMMGLLLVAWAVSLPQHSVATLAPPKAVAWEEVEYPSADFSLLTYFDDRDEARYDRMLDSIVEASDVDSGEAATF
jgi:anti-sigma factor RsiW